jgi:hypothetical protein
VLRQRHDLDAHVREQREIPENLVQFVSRLDVENADVAELTHNSPQMNPLALALKVL